jgi:flavin reductase (DIM6/NTAB) family NADH-FMN oxidoreductase RutF
MAMPCPVWLVGTYDEAGQPNFMAVAWGGICCSQPPCVTVSLRRATHSYAAIVSRQAFTVNIPAESQVVEADYAGTVSGRDADKFAACGWTHVKSDLVDAPYIAEVSLVVECRLLHTLEIGLHTQFVGEILDIKADESVLGEKGYPDITKVRPFIWDSAHRRYFTLGTSMGKAWEIGKKIETKGAQ